MLEPLETADREEVGLGGVDQARLQRIVLLGVRQGRRVCAQLAPEVDPHLELRHADLEPLQLLQGLDGALRQHVPEAHLAVGEELDAGLLAGDGGDLPGQRPLEHAIDVRLVLEDEPRGAPRRGDLGGHRLLGVRPAGGRLDRAHAAPLDELGVVAELPGREVLGIDAPAAALPEQRGPSLERQGHRRADGLRVGDAHRELLLSVAHAGQGQRAHRGEAALDEPPAGTGAGAAHGPCLLVRRARPAWSCE